ncbi:MAG TPA: hypothetical protein VFQ45_21630 [Longimicrobium sp.]|nr:hypothetical protein [Longimicrobium sp.]
MPPPSPRVESIREAARLAVEQSSLRAVARAIPMSPMGLLHFIQGTQPYAATLRKLTAWFAARERADFPDDKARAALTVLLEGVPEKHVDAAAREVLQVLARTHKQARTRQPRWLERLLRDQGS